MKNFVDAFIQSINEHDPNVLPMANRYYATENGIPSALMLMETYRLLEKVNCIGTLVEDEVLNTAYVELSAKEGNADVVVGARLTGADDKISEIEINIYHSRSDTGFWMAVQDMEALEPSWDAEIPEDQRASRETLEQFAEAIFNPEIDGDLFPASKTCQLMEAGGLVMENVGYAQVLTAGGELPEFDEGTVRIPMGFGLGPIRPVGKDYRLLAIDEKTGVVVATALMDGYVSPYIVSDEISSCFVPVKQIGMHHSTLTKEMFEGISTCREMMATAENVTLAKFGNGEIIYITQNIKLRTLGGQGPWRDEVIVK